jgi:hypothetical protein
MVNSKAFGIALVTERGIVFQDLYYSSDVAIKEQWFERARREGAWEVSILYSQTERSKILLIEPHSYQIIICNLIERNTVSGQKLERYFRSIQKLKLFRKQTRRYAKLYPKAKKVGVIERTPRRSTKRRQKIQLSGGTPKETT